jgi:hypothetical protein
MLHGKNHNYLYALCKEHKITLEELYHEHRDLLTKQLTHELFYLLKEKKENDV